MFIMLQSRRYRSSRSLSDSERSEDVLGTADGDLCGIRLNLILK